MLGHFIDGQRVASTEGLRNINPSDTSDVVGEYALASAAEIDCAIDAAVRAFPAWSRSSPELRADILDRAAAEILARKDHLGAVLAREEGKTRADAVGEVVRAGRIFRFFAGEALRNAGDKLPSVRPGVEVDIQREPLGVVGIITPWNFPIAIPAWKIAPALAYGNTVVFKPAELVPASAWLLVDILHRAGLPSGVLNMVMGRGSVLGAAIVDSQEVQAVTFTGSILTGAKVGMGCMALGKKVQLEMGGKNPLIIARDADLDEAADVALQGAFYATGQRCTASSRLIVEAPVHDAFVEKLVDKLGQLTVGHALDEGTDIGPVVDAAQLEKDIGYIDVGSREGAELAFGGRRLDRRTKGFFLEPALFIGSTNDMRINREEIFGPVAAVIKAADYEEAAFIANDTPFGLASGICTTSLRTAARFRSDSTAGMVMVNLPTAGVDYHAPFGGRKSSSYGPREQGPYAREFYTNIKTSYIKT